MPQDRVAVRKISITMYLNRHVDRNYVYVFFTLEERPKIVVKFTNMKSTVMGHLLEKRLRGLTPGEKKVFEGQAYLHTRMLVSQRPHMHPRLRSMCKYTLSSRKLSSIKNSIMFNVMQLKQRQQPLSMVIQIQLIRSTMCSKDILLSNTILRSTIMPKEVVLYQGCINYC